MATIRKLVQVRRDGHPPTSASYFVPHTSYLVRRRHVGPITAVLRWLWTPQPSSNALRSLRLGCGNQLRPRAVVRPESDPTHRMSMFA